MVYPVAAQMVGQFDDCGGVFAFASGLFYRGLSPAQAIELVYRDFAFDDHADIRIYWVFADLRATQLLGRATVACNLAEAVPLVGSHIGYFLRGGPEIGENTLTRFFMLHIGVLPTVMFFLLGPSRFF